MKHSLVILKKTIFACLDKITDRSNNHGTRYKWYCACIEHINRAERDYFQAFPKLPKRSDFKSDVEFFKESARFAEAIQNIESETEAFKKEIKELENTVADTYYNTLTKGLPKRYAGEKTKKLIISFLYDEMYNHEQEIEEIIDRFETMENALKEDEHSLNTNKNH